MDAVLTTLIGAAPQLGGAGVLLLIIGLLMRRESQVSGNYRAELDRLNAAHATELRELREEISRLRTRVNELNTKLDAERERRRAAEDNHMGRHRYRQDRP